MFFVVVELSVIYCVVKKYKKNTYMKFIHSIYKGLTWLNTIKSNFSKLFIPFHLSVKKWKLICDLFEHFIIFDQILNFLKWPDSIKSYLNKFCIISIFLFTIFIFPFKEQNFVYFINFWVSFINFTFLNKKNTYSEKSHINLNKLSLAIEAFGSKDFDFWIVLKAFLTRSL